MTDGLGIAAIPPPFRRPLNSLESLEQSDFVALIAKLRDVRGTDSIGEVAGTLEEQTGLAGEGHAVIRFALSVRALLETLLDTDSDRSLSSDYAELRGREG